MYPYASGCLSICKWLYVSSWKRMCIYVLLAMYPVLWLCIYAHVALYLCVCACSPRRVYTKFAWPKWSSPISVS
jgi:hypothetical protein